MTFDICEPEMGMSFPSWNGRALSMNEFDAIVRDCPWFDKSISDLEWNTNVIPEYLAWRRTTASHHKYVTGGTVLQRNGVPYSESDRATWERWALGIWRSLAVTGTYSLAKGRKLISSTFKRSESSV